jgi:hypothetical protein
MKSIISYIAAFLLVLAGAFYHYYFVNGSAMCLSEMRPLAAREVIDQYLFGEAGKTMSEDEKKDLIRTKGGSYPECCWVNGALAGKTGWVVPGELGSYARYTIFTYFRDLEHGDGAYIETQADVTSCGKVISEFSMPTDSRTYEGGLRFRQENQ